jgi:hypothetical protein
MYRTDEWWKAVVRYRFDPDDDHEEVAVYLWHNDGEWTRKNKYVIKTLDAWQTDKTIIGHLFSATAPSSFEEDVPVSDYYEVDGGETVFRSDGWWKAILKIVQKGSYETEEVMVYLWQESEDDWCRRQKHTVRDEQSWHEEVEAIESLLGFDGTVDPDPNSGGAITSMSKAQTPSSGSTRTTESGTRVEEFEQFNRELDKHLSEGQTD